MRPSRCPRADVVVEPLAGCPDVPSLAGVLAGWPYPAFLVSGPGFGRLGRWSFLAADPLLTVSAYGDRIETSFQGRRWQGTAHPLRALRSVLNAFRFELPSLDLPLAGGAIGYLGYDLAPWIERLPRHAAPDSRLPDLYFGLYDTLIAVDHQSGRAHLVAVDVAGAGRESLSGRLRRWQHQIRQARPWEPSSPAPLVAASEIRSNFTPAAYQNAVARAIDYIAAGDIFQVNLSQRFHVPLLADPLELFLRLCRINPAPFAAFLKLDEGAVVSASPERFLHVAGDRVETRPIKGTRPRAADPAEDRRLAAELLASAKDRAELTMIVDLERNDLGRVCQYGTVQVLEPCVLESFATVHHLVATVTGRLHPRYDLVDLLRAVFPGGSITGAPKIRAMQIIDELEPTRRSLYTGSIGYIGFDGRVDLNIAIRTILVEGGRATFQVGGGIVADSDPRAEFQETLDKAKALFQSLCA